MVQSVVHRVVDIIVVHTSVCRKTVTSLFPGMDPGKTVVVSHELMSSRCRLFASTRAGFLRRHSARNAP